MAIKSLSFKVAAALGTFIVILTVGTVFFGNGRSNPSSPAHNQLKSRVAFAKAAKIHLSSTENHVAHKYKLSKLETRTARKLPVTAIGDSVMLDVKPNIKQVFPHSAVSGSVGRQFYSLPKIVRQLKASGHLSNYIVINLGTNGPPTQADINSVLKTVGNRHIFWINTRVPRSWQGTTNRLITKAAKQHKNVHVVNWYKASKGHSGWFASDRVHVDLTGAVYYTHTLAKEVSRVLN
ncbi:acyltransferase [Lentilactobacillus parafarraginis]|mgnify:FL=1|jgi:ribosomal protein L21E|uniref:Acyltransferase n=2 Tax=Lentilactobacillus parafarraginis TaxID=390842 RepID=A0A0R1YCX9_9LACO|nr:hypothetical protein [Lentilactobacillus parafarraginis]KRM40424.1 hypothetical protein FD47_GL002828 [Lentilactobacillus parafarraginis DSM 18390 = JCM 14109]TLQ21170.1 acyltransferase [Lentilactobacillus parafarraginis]